jgi:Glycosyl transferase family 90
MKSLLRKRRLAAACVGLALATLVGLSLDGVLMTRESTLRQMLAGGLLHPDNPRPYTRTQIANLAAKIETFHPRLLVFNGTSFEVYNLDHNNTQYMNNYYCGRCGKMIPLLVNALIELNTPRFGPGQPVFQLLFSDGDSINSDCVNPGYCNVDGFGPMPLFGSAPKDPTVLPNVKGFPHWFYLACLYEYKLHRADHCKWVEPVDRTKEWDELVDEIIWRGTDFPFLAHYKEFKKFRGEEFPIDLTNVTGKDDTTMELMEHWHDLSPRWRAVALSVLAATEFETWIDAKFTGSLGALTQQHKFLERGVRVSTTEKMTPAEMSQYKYQLDLGGGGGTTWRGTLSKLGMSGVLLHHETPTKDWFFDDMKEWIHYIPVQWSLVDLREKFFWAQRNQKQARKIADNANMLYDEILGEPYMKRLYNDLFVDYLGKVMDAYVPNTESWEQVMRAYNHDGFELRRVAACDDYDCHTFTESDSENHPYRLKDAKVVSEE